MKKLLAFYARHDYLSGKLLIYQAGEILYENSYSYASIEHQVKNQRKTKFKIASLTKAFTSMLAFILQEQNLLQLDESVNHYLPRCASHDEITLYHCLTNSSGIPDFASEEEYWDTTMRLSHSLDELIQSIKANRCCLSREVTMLIPQSDF